MGIFRILQGNFEYSWQKIGLHKCILDQQFFWSSLLYFNVWTGMGNWAFCGQVPLSAKMQHVEIFQLIFCPAALLRFGILTVMHLWYLRLLFHKTLNWILPVTKNHYFLWCTLYCYYILHHSPLPFTPTTWDFTSAYEHKLEYDYTFQIYFLPIGKNIMYQHTWAKILNLSKNSHFQSLNYHKSHNFKASFFTKFTFSKSHFSQNSLF